MINPTELNQEEPIPPPELIVRETELRSGPVRGNPAFALMTMRMRMPSTRSFLAREMYSEHQLPRPPMTRTAMRSRSMMARVPQVSELTTTVTRERSMRDSSANRPEEATPPCTPIKMVTRLNHILERVPVQAFALMTTPTRTRLTRGSSAREPPNQRDQHEPTPTPIATQMEIKRKYMLVGMLLVSGLMTTQMRMRSTRSYLEREQFVADMAIF